ncbi:MAG TPA: UvrD-helicase domain-containing protein, partial [Fibrobacteraceae bacterium]|nr:UvrD-helicase domain-containing protein [Fibrobacteraceae bacterium]
MADLASQIDLREHGIIEAHAGTGKTHTIVELTLRILQENNSGRLTHIREILLVTYTEKAAAELRARIRQGLEKRITTLSNQGENPKNAVLAAHLSDCLNNLHEALIGTIHGTCLRLLQSYPFETGMSFQSQMVSDRTGLEETLRDCLRQDWQEEKTKIPWALDFLRKRQIAWTEQDFQLVIATANALLDPNAQLSRAAAKGQTLSELYQTWLSFQEFSPELKQDFADKLKVVCDRIGEILQKPIGFDEERLQVLRTIQAQWSAGTAVSEQNPTAFRKRDQFGRKKLFTQASRKHPKTQALQDDLEAVAQHKRVHQLEDAEQFAQWVHAALICDAAEILRDRWQEEKRRQGLISFQDMLNLLHQAIQARPSFRQILRARLRYGIIDEFQDTSALQWEIFRRLFLEDDHGPRLYLVGDPKQSIYSFQGADVRSYLAARQQIAKVYSLRDNYRSLPATIEGYNQVLQTNADSGGWFGAIGISYDHPATSPPRQEACPLPSDPPWLTEALYHPVQVISLDGKANVRKHQLAEAVARIVHALHGRSLPVPNGPSWNMEPLQYHHFAVLVEKHSLAKSFQEEFQRQGIPCSKYHMGGLFGSDMALHLRALFEAIIAPPEEATTRQAALLTVFANRAPESLDVQKDLAPESPWSQALAHWAYLAEDFHWARLFRDILQRTRVRERLAGLLDGDRQQADLRQIMDYAIDFLYRDNTGLSTLVQHLRRLQKGNEEAGQDQDLLAKETEQSCVQILTMHASKGLQFPIVFLATAGSDSHMRHLACWTDAQQKRQVQPRPHALDLPGMNDAKTAVRQQAAEERRRLLYVALTRPQT